MVFYIGGATSAGASATPILSLAFFQSHGKYKDSF